MFSVTTKKSTFFYQAEIKKVHTAVYAPLFIFLQDFNYKFGLILLHSEIAGTIFRVTNSSRILHK